MNLIDAKIEQSIPGRVEKIVERYPERIAFKNKHIVFTWDALNRDSNRFARAIVDLAATLFSTQSVNFDKRCSLKLFSARTLVEQATLITGKQAKSWAREPGSHVDGVKTAIRRASETNAR